MTMTPISSTQHAAETGARRHSMFELVVAWLLPFSTGLLATGAALAGALLIVLSVLLRNDVGCGVGAVFMFMAMLTARTARREFAEAGVMSRQQHVELSTC
jgi:hypothetical protein